MNPSKVIEREKRWALPVAICAFAALGLLLLSEFLVRSLAVEGGAVDSIQAIHDDGSTLVLSGIVRGLAMLLLAAPLAYLFEATHARTSKVRRWVGVIVMLGPLMFGVYSLTIGVATKGAADDFIAQQATLYTEPPASVDAFLTELESAPNSVSDVIIYPEESAFDALDSDGKTFTLEFTDNAQREEIEKALEAADVEVAESTAGEPGDLAATNLFQNSSGVSTFRGMVLPALLCLVIGVIYTALNSMRVGLLTRFYGYLGVAIGILPVILGPQIGVIGVTVWAFFLGFLFIDKWPGARPPAWDSGVSVPWPVRGQDPENGDADADGDVIDEPVIDDSQPGAPGTPGTSPRKRKQRSR